MLLYALVANVIEKPDGIAISGVLHRRHHRRLAHLPGPAHHRTAGWKRIEFDEAARQFITDSIAFDGQLNVIANKRQAGDKAEYADKEHEQRGLNPVPGPADVSSWRWKSSIRRRSATCSGCDGVEVDGYRVLRVKSPAVPNAIAAVLLALRDSTGAKPHCYFEWSEGNPIGHLFRYLFLGRGRHRAGGARDPPRDRARPGTPARHPRRLGRAHSDHNEQPRRDLSSSDSGGAVRA